MNATTGSSALFEVAARPFPFRAPLAATALVVIDMQRDFIEPGGTLRQRRFR